jgi:O-antigen/teichoic acid export membrane protein
VAALALERRVSREQTTLRRLIGKTAAWSTLDVLVGRIGQFALGVAIARIVAPREFGVFAIALVVHMVVVNISELGVSSSLIRDEAAQVRLSAPTVAALSVGTGLVLGGLVAALSGVLASALGSSHAAAPIAVMSLNLPLAGLTAVPSALLRRDFKMARIFVADTSNMLVSAIVVLPLALAGWGALALAWSWVAGQVATTVIMLAYRPGRIWPGWDKSQARRLLDYGLPLAGANLLTMLVLNVDYVIVGHVLGAEKLGLYMLAFNISGWPINLFGAIIRSVSLPAFSRMRLEGRAMAPEFARAIRFVAAITVPVCFIIGALARPAVLAIYGARWAPAASALVGLSVLGVGRILIELCGDFLVAEGHTRPPMFAQVPWLVALSAILLVLAPRYGIGGVGAGQAFVVIVIMMPIYALMLRRAGVPARATISAVAPAAGWGLVAAIAAHLVASTIDSALLACLAGGAVGVLVAAVPFAPTLRRRGLEFATRLDRRAPHAVAAEPVEPVDPVAHVSG